MASSKRLLPTGECWCVCRVEKAIGSFCLPGHEEVVEAAVMYVGYNAAPRFLMQHGYGPECENPNHEMAMWRSRG